MKIKTLAVQGVAALAFCGLFAPNAGAHQPEPKPYAYAFCGPKEPAVQAWYEEANIPTAYEERDAAWRVDKYKYCAVVVAKLTESAEVTLGNVVKACVAEYIDQPWDIDGPSHVPLAGRPWTEGEINAVEKCVGANATATSSSRKARAKHRKHKQRNHRATMS